MPLSGLHTNWTSGSYVEDRNYFMKQRENATGPYTRPYYDGSIAIGYGFDLLVRTPAEINSYFNRVNDELELEGTERVTLSPDDIALLNEARTATPARRYEISQQLDLRFPSQDYATTLLVDILLPDYETALDEALGGPTQLLQSKERIAVISLVYNMADPTAANIGATIPKTILAIQNDNRAEAWYEIRYNSNGGANPSQIVADRRYIEANLFGLYDSGTLTTDQAKEVMRMYTIHETDITSYERRYSRPADVPSIDDDWGIGFAKNYLIVKFASGTTIDGKVIVGAGLDSYAYLGENINDPESKLTGTENNDLIFGEKGNDTLNGAGGTDVMIGGANDDTYKVDNSGDVIVENDGEGKDLVQSTADNYTLPNYVEDLTLMGTKNIDGTGNELPNVITGNKGNNRLEGGAGDDRLSGGSGNNEMSGGADNDILHGNGSRDFLFGDAGNDNLDGGTGDDKLYGEKLLKHKMRSLVAAEKIGRVSL